MAKVTAAILPAASMLPRRLVASKLETGKPLPGGDLFPISWA